MNTLNKAFQAYIRFKKSSSKGTAVDVNRWEHQVLPFFGDVPLSQIKSYNILEFRAHLEEAGLSPQTVLHYLSLLRRILRKAVTWELYSGPVPFFEMPKFDNTRIRFLSQKEVGALLCELKKHSSLWHDISLFGLQTGLRAGEIFSIQKEHVDFSNRLVHVVDTKTNQNRVVPLNNQSYSLLFERAADIEQGFVFSYAGKENRRIKAVSCTFPRSVEASGVNDNITDRRNKIVFHSLRHTFASWLVQAGTPLLVVSSLLGHTSLRMTMRYAHLAPNQNRDAVENLPMFD